MVKVAPCAGNTGSVNTVEEQVSERFNDRTEDTQSVENNSAIGSSSESTTDTGMSTVVCTSDTKTGSAVCTSDTKTGSAVCAKTDQDSIEIQKDVLRCKFRELIKTVKMKDEAMRDVIDKVVINLLNQTYEMMSCGDRKIIVDINKCVIEVENIYTFANHGWTKYMIGDEIEDKIKSIMPKEISVVQIMSSTGWYFKIKLPMFEGSAKCNDTVKSK